MSDPMHFERREFLMSAAAACGALLIPGCSGDTLAQKTSETVLDRLRNNSITDTGISWCGARDVPDEVSSFAELATKEDKGERLKITGKVVTADGLPVPNVLIYLYHTDIHGIYGRDGEHRHGRYRAWLLTNDKGEYEFRTIRPASYPNSTISAHIHMTVTSVEKKEDWIDSILFEGDRFISASERRQAGQKGGFQPILRLEKLPSGDLAGRRDIQIG